MNKFIVITTLLFLSFSSCEKEEIQKKPSLLSEVIYGNWELREELDFSRYRDNLFRQRKKPYLVYEFHQNDSFAVTKKITESQIDTLEIGPFNTSDQDSILAISNTEWKVIGFSEDSLDLRISGREGFSGWKLFKVE